MGFETADNCERAWCGVEMMMAFAFMYAGKLPWIIDATLAGVDDPSKITCTAEKRPIPDPSKGKLYSEDDRRHVMTLLECASTAEASPVEKELKESLRLPTPTHRC